MGEFPVNSVAFFTQRTAFFSVGNVKCVWILAPDSSLHAFAVSHASNRPRFGGWLPASKGPQEDGELPLLARRVGVGSWRCKGLLAALRRATGYGCGWLPKTSRTHAFGMRKSIGYSASRETTWEDPFGNDPNDPFACARAMECRKSALHAVWVYPKF